MGIAANIVTSITAAVMAIVPASCSKTTAKSGAAAKTGSQTMASATATASSFAAPVPDATNSDSKSWDLGELSLTNNYELEVAVAHGKTCLIVPRILDRKTVQLTMSLRTKNASGRVEDLTVRQITGDIGKPFDVAVGDMDLTLTPQIVQE
jgi:hypothetical protein